MKNRLSYCQALFAAAGAALCWPSLAAAAPPKAAVMVLGEDCATIYEKGLDKQDNMRATLIRIGCGLEPAGDPELFAPDMTADALIDVANVNTITGTETFSSQRQFWIGHRSHRRSRIHRTEPRDHERRQLLHLLLAGQHWREPQPFPSDLGWNDPPGRFQFGGLPLYAVLRHRGRAE